MTDHRKINVRLPYLLSAAVLQPTRDFSAHVSSLPAQQRISEVPSRDAMLRFLGFDSFYLQAHTFPAFMNPDTSAAWKLRGILDPAAIGELDRNGDGTLILHPSVAAHIRTVSNKRKLEHAE